MSHLDLHSNRAKWMILPDVMVKGWDVVQSHYNRTRSARSSTTLLATSEWDKAVKQENSKAHKRLKIHPE